MIPDDWVTPRPICHRIWITKDKSSMGFAKDFKLTKDTPYNVCELEVAFFSIFVRNYCISITFWFLFWVTHSSFNYQMVMQVHNFIYEAYLGSIQCQYIINVCASLIARFMGPTWGPPGADRTQIGPMLAPWSLLSGFPWIMLTIDIWYFVVFRYFIIMAYWQRDVATVY